MINMRLSEAAAAMGGELCGADREFRGVSTDTRTLQRGELFFALKGEIFDAHEMCELAADGEAAACVVEKNLTLDAATIRVRDTREALGRLAHCWRTKHELKVVGVTGSNGKTTVKEMTAAILRQRGSVLATQGNFNNEVGLPKTLFQLREDHQYAVLEMGANHVGEIARLAAIGAPDVALITLCAPAHLEGFGSIEKVAEAKGEIYESLSAHGTAVVNADDDYCEFWQGLIGARNKIMFGMNPSADVYASDVEVQDLGLGVKFNLNYRGQKASVKIPHDGLHNVMNALAASASALALGCTFDDIARGLSGSNVVSGRLNVHKRDELTRVIDDTYNANPTSLMAAVQLTANVNGEAWVVLGDMGELGADGEKLHAQCGVEMRESNIARLFTVGELSKAAAQAFGANSYQFDHKDELNACLNKQLSEREEGPLTILVKGSRSAGMEAVVSALVKNGEETC
ncbi:MAG: UDP-N-acetylmuramoyl-tripeptide--D-alanyl-D-alanine ligase [Gammaproteobacteria bacterium]